MKGYVVGVWNARKQKQYSDDLCPSQLQSLVEDLKLAGVEGQTDGKLYSSGEGGTERVRICLIYMYVYECGCMVDGSNAMVASQVLLSSVRLYYTLSPATRTCSDMRDSKCPFPLRWTTLSLMLMSTSC